VRRRTRWVSLSRRITFRRSESAIRSCCVGPTRVERCLPGRADSECCMDQKTSPFRNVLITGARGLLGTPTTTLFTSVPGSHVTAMGHADLDITDPAVVERRMEQVRPDLVVNCAAYTKVDDCERNSDLAMQANGEGPGNVARAAAAVGARLMHISTD